MNKVCGIARAIEQSEKQACAIESVTASINKVSVREKSHSFRKIFGQTHTGSKVNKTSEQLQCYNCREGHKRKDKCCPAIGKQCRYCKQIGHF